MLKGLRPAHVRVSVREPVPATGRTQSTVAAPRTVPLVLPPPAPDAPPGTGTDGPRALRSVEGRSAPRGAAPPLAPAAAGPQGPPQEHAPGLAAAQKPGLAEPPGCLRGYTTL